MKITHNPNIQGKNTVKFYIIFSIMYVKRSWFLIKIKSSLQILIKHLLNQLIN